MEQTVDEAKKRRYVIAQGGWLWATHEGEARSEPERLRRQPHIRSGGARFKGV
jgi:hypothetical protein